VSEFSIIIGADELMVSTITSQLSSVQDGY